MLAAEANLFIIIIVVVVVVLVINVVVVIIIFGRGNKPLERVDARDGTGP